LISLKFIFSSEFNWDYVQYLLCIKKISNVKISDFVL